MPKTYRKVDDWTLEEEETTTVTDKRTYRLKELKEKRQHLLDQIARQREELERLTGQANAEIAELDALITKAQELGIVEEGVM